mmetsp:Transcript_20455/g.32910  ORF Transcript_20455/g.32910 Transcript_20455/m.32910 type:complete len:169 (+) Transcript_20455:72-578(+)
MIRSASAKLCASSSLARSLIGRGSRKSVVRFTRQWRKDQESTCFQWLRQYSSTSSLFEGGKKTVSITYVEAKDGTSKTVDAEIGMDLMNVAHENDIELEGACGGELACSTCHLIFEKKIYDTLPEISEDEVDMLDLAFEVTDTSRLGCQILVREDFEGMTVTIPDDGF